MRWSWQSNLFYEKNIEKGWSWHLFFREKAGENMAREIAEAVTAVLSCFIIVTENNNNKIIVKSQKIILCPFILVQNECLSCHKKLCRHFTLSLRHTVQLNGLFMDLIINEGLLHPHLLAGILFFWLFLHLFPAHQSPCLAPKFSICYIGGDMRDLTVGYSPPSTEPWLQGLRLLWSGELLYIYI